MNDASWLGKPPPGMRAGAIAALVISSFIVVPRRTAAAQGDLNLGFDVGWVHSRLPKWNTKYGDEAGDGLALRVSVIPVGKFYAAVELHAWKGSDDLSRGDVVIQPVFVPFTKHGVTLRVHGAVGYGRAEVAGTTQDGPVVGIGGEAEFRPPCYQVFGLRVAWSIYLQGLSGGHHSYSLAFLGISVR